MKNNSLNVVIKETEQRIKAETTKFQKYVERNDQFVQSRLFQTNQSLKSRQNDVKPNAEKRKKFEVIFGPKMLSIIKVQNESMMSKRSK